MVGGVEDLVAEQVVHIILLDTIRVSGIGGHSMHAEVVAGLIMVDHVGRVVDVAHSGGGCSPQIRGGRRASSGGSSGLARRSRCGGGSLSLVGQLKAFWVVVDNVAGFSRQCKGRVRWVHAKVARATASDAEGRNLAHINPDTVEGHLLVVRHDLICPEFVGLGVVPVREDGISGPDSSNVLASIGVLQEDVVLVSPGVGIIARQVLDKWRHDKFLTGF